MPLKSLNPKLSLFIATFLLSFSNLAFAAEVKDLPKNSDLSESILKSIEKNAITLDKNNNFRPSSSINRAEFIKAAFTYLDYKNTNNSTYTGYLDIPTDSWYAPFIQKAQQLRIYPQGNGNYFNPESPINREEALLIGMSTFGIPAPLINPLKKDLYSDIRPTRSQSHLFAAAKKANIAFPFNKDRFYPNKILTRADAAELLDDLATASITYQKFATNNQENSGIQVEVNDVNSKTLLENEKFAILLSTWSKINTDYIYQDKIDQDELVYGAIRGMVESLNDQYSKFKSPENNRQETFYVPEGYEGIGAVIEKKEQNYQIQATILGSPAALAGLQVGDIIQEINNQKISELSIEQVSSLLKGKAGTNVTLKISRKNNTQIYTLTRTKILLDTVTGKIIDNQIIYLSINEFSDQTEKQFLKTLSELSAEKYDKMIIDLRNDPGGYLTTTQEILNHFLSKNSVIFYTKNNDGSISPYFSEGPGELGNKKIAVLINEGTASAAEIVAGALQFHQKAKLIGTNSYGKGTIQEINTYFDDSSLKLTIAEWLTPAKISINHLGLTPDIKSQLTSENLAQNIDGQLQTAINFLR